MNAVQEVDRDQAQQQHRRAEQHRSDHCQCGLMVSAAAVSSAPPVTSPVTQTRAAGTVPASTRISGTPALAARRGVMVRAPATNWPIAAAVVGLRERRCPARSAIRVIRARNPLALTSGGSDHLYPAITAGATGFLTKDADPDELLSGIRRAADGDNPYSTTVLRRIVNAALQASTANTELEPRPVLTPRERDVLALLGEGLSNRDIADRIAISVTTAKTHVARLMERTGATNRVQLALLAVRHNITR